ncbi:hypothetical protein C8Q78DRAFT_311031 [Trametes maxima]|nr:hypothetical protein C8Q78DRAFT_311031 [Trametes maxima]
MVRLSDGDGSLPSGIAVEMNIDLDLGLDADTHSRVALCFDDDADTIKGSHVCEDGLLFSDSDGSSVVDNNWSTHTTKPHPVPGTAPDDFDDLWGSSQETLDDQAFEWDDHTWGASQASGTDNTSPDPYPQVDRGSPDLFLADDDDDEHGHWLDGLDDVQAPLGTLYGQHSQSLAHSPERFLNSMAMDCNSFGDELSFDDPDTPDSEACTDLLELFDDALEAAVASRPPVCVGDDLVYGIGGSRTVPPFTVTSRGPAERSPDDDKLSSIAALHPSSDCPDPGPASRGLALPSVRKRSHSPETALLAGTHWAIDEGAHGRNEDGLVAGHAPAIRPGQERVMEGWADWLARATGGGTRGSGSDRESEKGVEDAMLWAE